MRTIIIPKGWHAPINELPTIVKTDWMTKDILFEKSCRYDTGVEQKDWLKLMGFSIGLLPQDGKKPMHYNSVRFGWRYNPETDKIEVAPYWYVKGVRHYAETDGLAVASLDVDKVYSFYILKGIEGEYYLAIKSLSGDLIAKWNIDFPMDVYAKYGWSATLWFGGNAPAPHTVKLMKGKLPE